ncbi:hypothetical protein NKI77_31995 [Mesorhizobium opportunistum]|uniref:hypothetical protein n=1 Tax=Mesorhizobium opportunistum TaxID=593909 RepID=UPI0033371A75
MCSSASSISSPGKGQVNPIAAARCRLSLHRAARYSQDDRNLAGAGPASGKPQHLSQLSHGQPFFAGIKISPFIARYLMPKLLTQEVIFSAENWPTFDWNGGRCLIGLAAGFMSESAI